MSFNVVLLCVSALLVQSTTGQCLSGCGSPVFNYDVSSYGCGPFTYGCDATPYGCGCGYDASCGCGFGNSYNSLNAFNALNTNYVTFATNGGNLIVSCYSPITPAGISVDSNLELTGNLDVYGIMPFLSAVQFSTELPSYGSGCVDYSCGAGCNFGIDSISGGYVNGIGGCLNGVGGYRNGVGGYRNGIGGFYGGLNGGNCCG